MFSPQVTMIAVVVLVVLSVGGLIYGVFYSYVSSQARGDKRIANIRESGPANTDRRPGEVASRRKSVQESLKEMEERQKAKARRSVAPPLMLKLQQAGLNWSKSKFTIISVVAGVGAFMLALLFGAKLLVAAGIGFVGGFGFPRWYVSFLRKRRQKKFLSEFVNAVDVIVRGVKAGLPIGDCFRVIAKEAQEPVKTEFVKIVETQAMGVPLADAVGRIYERMPLPEANFFAIVISIQQKAGGNLSEALSNLSKVLRGRKKMQGKIRAMSQEAKASAGIIGSLPIIVMLLVFLTTPDYILILFETQSGNIILGASAFWMFLGIMVMKKMINFDF